MSRFVALGVLVLLACTESEPSGPFGYSRVERKVIPFGWSQDVDLLIVVDRSPAMATYRDQLLAQVSQLVDTFDSSSLGMPSLHIGVITSDLGAEGVAVPGCAGDGGGGRLRTDAQITGGFLSDVAAANGTRIRNYQGSLTDAVARLLDAGTTGCPYSRPLAAAKRALEGNAELLREDAYLYVVFITAQDDCSFDGAGFLGGSTSTDTSRCTAMAASLPAVSTFATYLKSKKADPAKVMVGGIIGDASAGTCVAAPRLHAFLDEFPNRSARTSVCGSAYVEGFALLAQLLKTALGAPCWESELLDTNADLPGLQPDCAASYVFADGEEGTLPLCADGDTRLCWLPKQDAVSCPGSALSLDIDRHGVSYPYGAVATIECLVAAE